MEYCSITGIFDFPGGSCAQWFSGSASALAVAVAVSAQLVVAHRQRKSDDKDDSSEIGALSMMIGSLLDESMSHAKLVYQASTKIEFDGDEFNYSTKLGGLNISAVPSLTKNQTHILLKNNFQSLARDIERCVRDCNLASFSLAEFATVRSDFSDFCQREDVIGDHGHFRLNCPPGQKMLIRSKLRSMSGSVEFLSNETYQTFEKAIAISEKFNSACSGMKLPSQFQVDLAEYQAVFAKIESL